MSQSRRKLYQIMMLLSKQLKKPIANLVNILPSGFSDKDFIDAFKTYYTFLWEDINKEYKYYLKKNEKFRGNRPLLFPKPHWFVLKNAKHKILKVRKPNYQFSLSEDEKACLRNKLEDECRKKMNLRHLKQLNNMKFTQNVVPNYSTLMINSYFKSRHSNPDNIDFRYYVLSEISKFDSHRFDGFYFYVMDSERNDFLREYAFRTLQKHNVGIHLTKKRKGKKRVSDKLRPQIPTDPDGLLQLIRESSFEQAKSYNVFISHRYTDSHRIIELKEKLNKLNMSVYVDWMLDRDGLQRNKFNANTINVLQNRIKSCNCVLYVHTDSCSESEIIPIELECAKSNNIPIVIYNEESCEEKDGYQLLPHLTISNDGFFVVSDEQSVPFVEWFGNIRR